MRFRRECVRPVMRFGLTCLFLSLVEQASAQSVQWTRQIGTSSSDEGKGVSADGLGNVYISGITYGNLGGPIGGDRDAFVSKFDAAGNLLWTTQVGTNTIDESSGVSADGLGNVYISSLTWGSLGGSNAGVGDVFVSKFDDSGDLLWNRQFGTSLYEESYDISADGLGNVYVSGFTTGSLDGTNAGSFDAFVSKYDFAGNLAWIRQIGTSADDVSNAVSADGLGNVYISGYTRGSLDGTNAGGDDVFVSKYNDAGDLQWTRQFGTDDHDHSAGISADGLGSVYISGGTTGELGGSNTGSYDAFVSEFDAAGNLLWTRQLGTSVNELSLGVSAEGLGNVYISGHTDGDLAGFHGGSGDAFVSKLDDAGNFLWTMQLGTSEGDFSYGVSADGLGNVYMSGSTDGSLGNANAGGTDAFVAKIVPEPNTLVLSVIGGAILCQMPRRRAGQQVKARGRLRQGLQGD